MKMIKVTEDNRNEMIFQYADTYVDFLDFESMRQYAISGIIENLKNYTNQDLTDEINSLCPNFLETE